MQFAGQMAGPARQGQPAGRRGKKRGACGGETGRQARPGAAGPRVRGRWAGGVQSGARRRRCCGAVPSGRAWRVSVGAHGWIGWLVGLCACHPMRARRASAVALRLTELLSGTASKGPRVSVADTPAEVVGRSSGRVWGFASLVKAPTALDGACSVFDVFGAEDVLMMADADCAEPYEVAAAHAWRRVGDSMRAAIDARLAGGRA